MKDKKQKAKAAANPQSENLDESVPNVETGELEPETEIKVEEPDDKDKRIAEMTEKWMRTLAEFDNFRKRTIKEKASMYDDGVRDTIAKLLPVIDNFERALSSETDRESSLYKGVDMISKQLEGYLKDMGVEEIPGIGENFDPNIHFAVSHAEDESLGENEVAEVMQKGYRYKEKIIRPAMVKVVN